MSSQLRTRIALAGAIAMLTSCVLADEASQVTVDVQTVARQPDGTQIDQYTLANSNQVIVRVLNYGATITGVLVPDRNGRQENVILHLDKPGDYLQGHPLFGSIVGRYANRIAGAAFSIDGQNFNLTKNAGQHHIHGGQTGFQKIVWDAKRLESGDRAGVELSHVSADGHEGYPGTLQVKVRYLLGNDNCLKMEYWAQSDKSTHVNLTNHAYWNLAGVTSGNVLDHVVMINADQYLDANKDRFPTGQLLSVAGTCMDFRTPHAIGARINDLESANYDDCYVLNGKRNNNPLLAARVVDSSSGRAMEVYTTAPGVQFYTAKGLNGRFSINGIPYGPYHGFCLETQHFPDSPNQPQFPSTLLRPGETYHQITVHRFLVDQ